MKPTVEWIKGLGLSQSQVAKVILQRPQVLGLSIEAKPEASSRMDEGVGDEPVSSWQADCSISSGVWPAY